MLDITFDRKTKLYYLKNDKYDLIFDNFEHLYWIKDTLNTSNEKNETNETKWKIDKKNNLLYCLDDNLDKVYLIEKITNSSIKDKKIIFIDNNHYNYCLTNIKIETITNDEETINTKRKIYHDIKKEDVQERNDKIFKKPDNFPNDVVIIDEFTGHKIMAGKKSGQIFNPYWLVHDSNDKKNKYYIMSCNEDQFYFLFSDKSIDYIKGKTWFKTENGYITTVEKVDNKRVQYYLHQLVCKTEKGDESDTKSVEHINRNKLDNRIENLRWATQSEQNSNTDKRARKHNAIELPDEIKNMPIPKYVSYTKEILNKKNGRSRSFFRIDHPKLEKIWSSSKSNKIPLIEKLNETKKKLQEIEA
jgi:hypothetical protein